MNKASKLNNAPRSGKSRTLAVVIPLAMLTVATLLAFFNAWPDSLVLDDKGFVGPGRPHALDSIYNIFTSDVWAAVGLHGGLYRPLLLLSLSLETWVFGDWLAGYHLSNIFQHLLVTFLVYGFLRHLLRTTSNRSSSSDLYALLAALIFAVHPVHTEVVDSVFNRSETMVALFGLAGLWWLLHYLDTHPGRGWFGFGIAYFLGLLSKESAIFLPLLAIALILLLRTDDFIIRIRKSLPALWLALPLALYIAMRAYALAQPAPASGGEAAGTGGAELVTVLHWMAFPGLRKFLIIAQMLGETLKVIVWPYPLHLYYSRPSAVSSAIYLALNPILIIASLVQIKRRHYALAAGLAFFYIAMLPATRLFQGGGVPLQLSERYLYFPSVGLAIILAFAFRAIAQRFGPRVLVGFGMPVLLVLTALTWDRNADWSSDLALYEAEYQMGNRGENTLRLVTSAQLAMRNTARVVTICDENRARQEKYSYSTFLIYCARAYEKENRFADAERTYLISVKNPSTRIGASLALANFYIRHGRPQDAEKQFKVAIDGADNPADKALYQAEMVLGLNPRSRKQGAVARGYIEEALRLRPGWREAESMLEVLDKALNSSPTDEINERVH